MIALLLSVPAWAGANDLCDESTLPDAPSGVINAACVDESGAAADLRFELTSTTTCIHDCEGPVLAVYVAVVNDGSADVESVDLRLRGEAYDANTTNSTAIAAGEGAILGPYVFTGPQWGSGLSFRLLDTDCDMDNNLLELGPWPYLGEDADEDGFESGTCGDDCDDSDPDIHALATEVWYDGVDQDCDGQNDYDADGDGYIAEDHGGDDCDDSDPTIHPDAQDINCDEDWDPGDDDTAEKADTTKDPACGCSGTTGAGGVLALMALALMRQRRPVSRNQSRQAAMPSSGSRIE